MTSSDDLINIAVNAGWSHRSTRNNHQCLTPPKGVIDPRTGREAKPVFFPSTPSDWRSEKNLAAHLRRLGLNIPRK